MDPGTVDVPIGSTRDRRSGRLYPRPIRCTPRTEKEEIAGLRGHGGNWTLRSAGSAGAASWDVGCRRQTLPCTSSEGGYAEMSIGDARFFTRSGPHSIATV